MKREGGYTSKRAVKQLQSGARGRCIASYLFEKYKSEGSNSSYRVVSFERRSAVLYQLCHFSSKRLEEKWHNW